MTSVGGELILLPYIQCLVQICAAPEVPEGYFDVTFLEMTHNCYSSKAVLWSGLSLECALLTSKLCSPDLNNEVEQSLTEVPLYRLFQENPLKTGFYLYYYNLLYFINLLIQFTQPTVFVMIIASRSLIQATFAR